MKKEKITKLKSFFLQPKHSRRQTTVNIFSFMDISSDKMSKSQQCFFFCKVISNHFYILFDFLKNFRIGVKNYEVQCNSSVSFLRADDDPSDFAFCCKVIEGSCESLVENAFGVDLKMTFLNFINSVFNGS